MLKYTLSNISIYSMTAEYHKVFQEVVTCDKHQKNISYTATQREK